MGGSLGRWGGSLGRWGGGRGSLGRWPGYFRQMGYIRQEGDHADRMIRARGGLGNV